LHQLAEDHDCYFTIETAYTEGESMNAFTSQLIKRTDKPSGVSNSEQLRLRLTQICSTINNFAFFTNTSNPRIIHLVDKRLVGQAGYAMDMVVTNISFVGKIPDLFERINSFGIPVSQQMSFGIGDPLHFAIDTTTVLNVKGTNLPVRDVISNFIDLQGYSRVVWVATTKIGHNEPSQITFRGPRRK
jgi:hypothetical protein